MAWDIVKLQCLCSTFEKFACPWPFRLSDLCLADKWWQQVWTFFAAKGVALLSLVVAMLALALHWKRSKTGNTTVNIVVIALPPFVTSVYQYRVLILLWETDRGVSFGRHVYFVSCTIEYAAHAK